MILNRNSLWKSDFFRGQASASREGLVSILTVVEFQSIVDKIYETIRAKRTSSKEYYFEADLSKIVCVLSSI